MATIRTRKRGKTWSYSFEVGNRLAEYQLDDIDAALHDQRQDDAVTNVCPLAHH